MKLHHFGKWMLMHVAPRVGAWIETLFVCRGAAMALVAPRVGAWIETGTALTLGKIGCRPPRGGVD